MCPQRTLIVTFRLATWKEIGTVEVQVTKDVALDFSDETPRASHACFLRFSFPQEEERK